MNLAPSGSHSTGPKTTRVDVNPSTDAPSPAAPTALVTLVHNPKSSGVQRGARIAAGQDAPLRPSLLRAGGHQSIGRSDSNPVNFNRLNPVLWWSSVLTVDFNTGERLSRITYPRWPSDAIPAASDDPTNTVPLTTHPVINSGAPHMSNIQCPFERSAERMSNYKRMFRAIALRDNDFDAEERALHDFLTEEIHILHLSSARRKLARHVDQMIEVTEYTQRLATAADLSLLELDDYRTPANVIQLRPDHHHAG